MRTVRQLLGSKTPEIFAVSPDASVLDAIKLMAEKGVGAVLAMQGARLCGIVLVASLIFLSLNKISF